MAMVKNADEIILCDMHSHILPGIDDGCKSADEALSVLRMCAKQNIKKVFMTPHYYSDMPVNEFIIKRQRAYSAIKPFLTDGMPKIMLGAEVAYRRDLTAREGIEKLTLGGTNYILLEMPFEKWQDSAVNDLRTMKNSLGLEPVIAHIERYYAEQPAKTINALLDIGVHFQMNAEYIIGRSTGRKAKKLIKRGYIDLLGSDCHGIINRVQNLGVAAQVLAETKMAGELADFCGLANMIFDSSKEMNIVKLKRPRRD